MKTLAPYFENELFWGICVQCCPLNTVLGLVDEINEAFKSLKVSRLPRIMAYPNSGEIYDGKTKTWHWSKGLEGKCFADYGEKLAEKGASVIGGCCRVGPCAIKELSDRLTTETISKM